MKKPTKDMQGHSGLLAGCLNPGRAVVRSWRLMTVLWQKGTFGRCLARLIKGHIRRAYACYISPTSRVGRDVFLPHPVGVVIGDDVVVGDRVTIYQNVTLGRAHPDGPYPRVEAGATLFAGAVVIGDIVIGQNAVIGANAVVRETVPPFRTAVGVPARLVQPR